MGWATAGTIFENVADGLIDAKASDEIKKRVLGDLCEALQNEDWDTEYESLDRYLDDPVIVQVFAEHGIDQG